MPDIDVGAEIAGHRLEEVIGRGGMGVVYKARDLTLDRVVALKLIAPEFAEVPEFRDRFKRESREAASIRHPNVISIYRAGEDGDLLFITMDYVEGTDLKTFIGARGRLDPDLAATLVSQVAGGLEAAHSRGLVHRDVKPANVLIEDQRQAYLTDFGLTKRAARGSNVTGGGGAPLTRTGLIVGTTDYLAPEQIQEDKIDARVDVYALGCVLYEALTGSVPYPRDNPAATMWAHMSDPPPSVLERAPDLPAEFDDVVRRAMAKDPDERFPSARAMGDAISDAAGRASAVFVTETVVAPELAETEIDRPTRSTDRAAEPAVDPRQSSSDFRQESVAPPPPPVPPAPVAPPPAAPPPDATHAGRGGDVPPPSPPASRRSPRLLLGAAVLGLVVVAAAAVALLAGGDDDGSGSGAAQNAAVPVAAALPKSLAWEEIRDAPFARQYSASTAVDGDIWVLGGVGKETSSTTTKSYDPDTNTWSTGPGLPRPLHHFMAVTYEGEAVVIGGFVPNADGLTGEQSDRVYALRDDRWEELPRLNRPRAAGAAAVVDGRIVVTGGQANEKLVTQTEVFDGEGWQDVADIPTPREHLGGASDGNYLYAIGGRELSAGENLKTLERYDPDTDSWKALADMPEASGSVGAAYVGGRLIAVGGESETSASDAVQGYDIRRARWSELPGLPSARHGVAVAALEGTVFAVGGATVAGHEGSTRAAERLDLGGGAGSDAPSPLDAKWQDINDAPFPRQYAALTESGGRLLLVGGIGEDEKGSRDTAAFDRVFGGWTKQPSLPRPLHHSMAVTYGGEAVVIGGFLPGETLTSVQSDRVYVFRDDKWDELARLNRPRAAGAAAVVGDKIVVTGGQANGKLVTETEVFDGETWKDVADIPTPREHLGGASDGRYLYAVGGRELSTEENLGTLERYDPASDSWEALADMPEATGSVGVAYLAGRLIAVGGESSTSASDVVQGYDIRRGQWAKLPALPFAVHGAAVAALKGSIFAVGGATDAGHVQSTAKAERLELG